MDCLIRTLKVVGIAVFWIFVACALLVVTVNVFVTFSKDAAVLGKSQLDRIEKRLNELPSCPEKVPCDIIGGDTHTPWTHNSGAGNSDDYDRTEPSFSTVWVGTTGDDAVFYYDGHPMYFDGVYIRMLAAEEELDGMLLYPDVWDCREQSIVTDIQYGELIW